MTADEFINQYYSEIPSEYDDISFLMTEFAKYHVEQALNTISIVCSKGEEYECKECYGGGCENPIIDKNDYPLENIK